MLRSIGVMQLPPLAEKGKEMAKKRKSYEDVYERFKKYGIDEVVSKVMDGSKQVCRRQKVIFDGIPVNMGSKRYKVFRENRTCVTCGLEATHFWLERGRASSRGLKPTQGYHFNLYGMKDGKEVMLTKDHIHPKSLGGSDDLSNLQTMCEPCNCKKANKVA